MKLRKGFVSNSSSSSFVCDVCGYTESGWDMSLEEAEMYECENGHTFCEGHIITPTKEQLIEYAKRILNDEEISAVNFSEWLDNKNYNSIEDVNSLSDIEDLSKECGLGEAGRYGLPECFCPLCNFEELSQADAREYLYITTGISPSIVFEEIKKINKRRKKLRDSEYVSYVLQKQNKNETELLQEIDERFNHSYKKFKMFIRGL